MMRSDEMWDINEIKSEHYESNREKTIVAIVQEDDGVFGIFYQTQKSVSPYIKYANARLAAARALQLLGLGPVAPQDHPEEIVIGKIDYKPADILELPSRDSVG